MRTYGGLTYYTAAGLVAPESQTGVGASQIGIVRNAIGDWSYNNVTPGVATFNLIPDNAITTRPPFNFPYMPGQGTVPLSNEYQEAFGTAAGGPGEPFSGLPSGNVTLPSPQFGSAVLPWGYAIVDVFAVYSVQTAALTAATLAINRSIFVENTVTVNTAVLAPTAIALTTTTSATTPHVQKITLPQPLVFEMADFSTLYIELLITTAATSALRVYGIGVHYAVATS